MVISSWEIVVLCVAAPAQWLGRFRGALDAVQNATLTGSLVSRLGFHVPALFACAAQFRLSTLWTLLGVPDRFGSDCEVIFGFLIRPQKIPRIDATTPINGIAG